MWLALKVFVNMVVFVWLFTIDPSVSVLLDSLVPDVRSMLMNVPLLLVTMVVPVLTCHKATDVTVRKDSLASNVMKKSLIVMITHALTEPCAEMNQDLATILVSANQATLEKLVTSVWIPVNPVLVPMELFVNLINKAGLVVFARMDGVDLCVIKTLMIVLKNLACSMPTVLT